MLKRLVSLLVVFSLFALLLCGCSTKEAENNGKPIVYASFYPVYDLVNQVVGDTVDLRTFMPIDKDPHLWEPTPKDIKRLAEADVLVVNGANMERWLDDVRGTLPDLEVLVLSDSVDLITYKGAAAVGDFQYMVELDLKKGEKYSISFGHTHEDVMRVAFMEQDESMSEKEIIAKGKKVMEDKGELVPQHSNVKVKADTVYALEMGHERGDIDFEFPKTGKWLFICDRVSEDILPYDFVDKKGDKMDTDPLLSGSTSGLDKITYDPHSWLSLVNAKKYLNAVNETFSKKYKEHERLYYNNKVKAIGSITQLEGEFKERAKELPIREFVVTHYAYAYLARDFDLRQFPLQDLVSTETPSLKTIRKALGFCEQYDITTIFYEEGHTAKGADTLAAEIDGGKAVPLTSMEYMLPDVDDIEQNYTDIMRENLEKLYGSMEK